MRELYIQQQRRRDFEKAFGVFSLWTLLPFKKLESFWGKLFKTTTNTIPQTLDVFCEVIEKNTEYIMKYVQGLYPV